MQTKIYSVVNNPIAREIMLNALGTDIVFYGFHEKSEENLLGLLINYLNASKDYNLKTVEEIVDEAHKLLVENPTGDHIKALPNKLSNDSVLLEVITEMWSENAFFATSDGWEESDKMKQIMYIKGLQRKLEQLMPYK